MFLKTKINLIVQGKELIRKRQKLIRMADKSADGWRARNGRVRLWWIGLRFWGRKAVEEGRAKDAANRKRS